MLCCCQEHEWTSIKDDIQGLKKKLNSKMDSLKEEAMKSDKNFEERFPALTHATEKKKQNSLGSVLAARLKEERISSHISYYQLPFKEAAVLKSNYSDDVVARILQFDVNHKKSMMDTKLGSGLKVGSSKEKSFLLVGVTGAGKSTFIDALANFYFNVRFEDKHRFKMINLTKAEKAKSKDVTTSQTDDITVYKIPNIQGANANFALNIIDTPGIYTKGLVHR
jgi:flagellar biosynthesis GTPase FlhF